MLLICIKQGLPHRPPFKAGCLLLEASRGCAPLGNQVLPHQAAGAPWWFWPIQARRTSSSPRDLMAADLTSSWNQGNHENLPFQAMESFSKHFLHVLVPSRFPFIHQLYLQSTQNYFPNRQHKLFFTDKQLNHVSNLETKFKILHFFVLSFTFSSFSQKNLPFRTVLLLIFLFTLALKGLNPRVLCRGQGGLVVLYLAYYSTEVPKNWCPSHCHTTGW